MIRIHNSMIQCFMMPLKLILDCMIQIHKETIQHVMMQLKLTLYDTIFQVIKEQFSISFSITESDSI